MWKVVVGLAAIFTLLALIVSFGDYRQSIRLFKFFAVVIIVWYLGNAIKLHVDIEDRCTGETFSNIEVPWAIGKAVSYATTLERNIREGLVNFFGSSLPDSYKNHEGCFTGYELLRPALLYSPKDPYLRISIRNYIKDCFIPNVLAGDIDRTALENSSDMWNDVLPCSLGQVCQSLTTTYYNSANPQGIVDTCPNVYARIDADIVNEYSKAWKVIKAQVFGTGSSIPESDIPVYLGEASSYLMATALTGDNLIRQAIAIQTLNQVSAEFATAVAYQEAYLSALARINMLDFGRGGTLNAMKGVIQVMIIGLTPAFFVLFVTPLGGKIFQGWIISFIWFIVWSIAEVIAVSILYLYLGTSYKFDFTLSDIDRLVFTFNKAAQISSLMSDWIPLIALMITTGSIYTLTQFAKGVSSDLRDQHGAKVMASGNFDAGNVRVDNYSQATRALANSVVGVENRDVYQGRVFTSDILNYRNETIGQSQIYDPTTGVNFKGVREGNGIYLGQVEGGAFSGSGRWMQQGNQWRLMNGTAQARTPQALSVITGGQISDLMNATVSMKDGNVVYAQGTDVNTGATVTYTRSDEGIEMLNYQLGGAGVKMMKDKDGEWRVVSADSPVSMKFASQYAESLSNTKAQMDRLSYLFRKGEGLSNTDSETFGAGYKLAYEIAHGKGGATETERGFARDLVKSSAEKALETLGKEGHTRTDGERITAQEAQAKGGIKIGLPKELLRNIFGMDVNAAFTTKEGWVVKDSKGQWWFFKRTEEESQALQDSWKTTVSGENKDFFEERERTTGQDYTDHSFKSDLQSFRNRVAEYAAQRSKELAEKLDYVEKNSREFGASMTHLFLGNMIKDAKGDNVQEKVGDALVKFNELLSTPEGIQKLQKMGDEVLDRMLKDRTLEKPDVNEEVVRNAGNTAKVEGVKAKEANVKGPSENPMGVYSATKEEIEGRGKSMKEGYEGHRQMVDLQKGVYEENMDSPLTFRTTVEELYKDIQELGELYGRKDMLNDRLESLKEQREEAMKKVKEYRNNIKDIVSPLRGSGDYWKIQQMMEKVKDPKKLKEYEEFVKSLPAYKKANYVDPNIIKAIRREWLKEQSALQEVKRIGNQIAQVQQEIAQVEKAIEEKKAEIEKNKDGIQFSKAQDMYKGNYSKTNFLSGYHTDTETKVKSATEWDEPTEWDIFRIDHKNQGEMPGP